MGQNASRTRSERPPPPPRIIISPPTVNEPEPPARLHPETADGEEQAGRKRSFRRSIMGLGRRLRTDSAASTTAGSEEDNQPARKRWRRSRRWSKAPAVAQPTSLVEHAEDAADSSTDDTSAGQEECPMPIQSNGKARATDFSHTDGVTEERRISRSVGSQSDAADLAGEGELDVANTSNSSARPLQSQLAARLGIRPIERSEEEALIVQPDSQQEEVVISPDPDTQVTRDEANPTAGAANETGPSQAAGSPTPGRRRPLPGTLIVVQGVVHTSEVPRPAATDSRSRSTSRPRPLSYDNGRRDNGPAPPQARRRASSTPPLQRTASVTDAPSVLPEGGSRLDEAIDITRPSIGSSDSEGSAEHDPTVTLTPEEQDDRERTTHGNALSRSSTDVLGTLLGVAAAATAASLLSGSANLGQSLASAVRATGSPSAQHSSEPSSTSAPPSDSPAPPTPAPMNGFDFTGLGLPSNPSQPPPNPVSRIWNNLRERLGMRPSANQGSEMSRALNLGLGLNQSHGSARRSSGDESEREAEETPEPPMLPPEDSFERFLIDLQVELRSLLSEGSSLSEESGSQDDAEVLGQNRTADAHPEGSTASDSEEVFVPLHELMVQPGEQYPDPNELLRQAGPAGYGVDHTALPQSSNVAASSSSEHDGDEQFHDAVEEQTPGTAQENSRPSQSGSERRPGDAINWWRLYRFPASAYPGDAASSSTSGESSPTSASDGNAGSSSAPTSSNADGSPEAQTTGANSPAPVAVIIVGLQSVDMTRAPPPASARPGETQNAEEAEDAAADASIPPAAGASGDTDGAQRNGRRWHSRAADAIRNLRHGRERRVPPNSSGPDSRTFLIYVIGGFYPPDHAILNGGGHLNPFEGLWELADLFSGAKPPTATRDDIESSGLEVITPDKLASYEKDGKVSSNCVDRCLICLDDYEPQDEVRVLRCKHGFHKNCVDTWLQTGRNNCPACRSTGIEFTSEFAPEVTPP